jgi:hypothetical protein
VIVVAITSAFSVMAVVLVIVERWGHPTYKPDRHETDER